MDQQPRTLTMSQVGGREEAAYEGIQNNPVVGAELAPAVMTVDDQAVIDYVNAVGDEQFWAFQARVRARHGIDVAPVSLLDLHVGARRVGQGARVTMHAKQEFHYQRPLVVGETYRLVGAISDVYNRRGIDYLSTRGRCVSVDDPSRVYIEQVYSRVWRFPDNQYNRGSGGAARPRLSQWLYDNGALPRVPFPGVGAVVEGRTFLLDQALVNLYSGPGAGIHTSDLVARRGGLGGPVAQGLMATELESEMYRDLFGLAYFRRGCIKVAYVEPIRAGVHLRAACVVQEVSDEQITLRSAVATETGAIVSVGTVSVRHWRTDEEIDD